MIRLDFSLVAVILVW